MPRNETLMRELKERYGEGEGEAVYWAMAGAGTGPFGPRGKYRGEHEALAKKAGTEPNKGKKRQGRGKEKPRTGGSRAVRGGGYRRRKR